MMQLVCIGVSYHTAPVTLREQVALTAIRQTQLLARVAADGCPGVVELAILSTCNRNELYAVLEADEGNAGYSGVQRLLAAWAEFSRAPADRIEAALFKLEEEEAVRHLFTVSCGLDSQIIGEPQILGQIADAYEQARIQGAARSILSPLFQRAIALGKRARTETTIGQGTLSIGSVAAHHSQHVLGSVAEATVLVIGTGEMAYAAASALVRHSADHLLVANHNLAHAQEFALALGGEVVPYTQLSQALEQADLVITAVSAPHPILQRPDLELVQRRRGDRRLIIFDIALPRNVDPEVGTLPYVQLFNLDDLQAVTSAHFLARQEAIPVVRELIEREVREYWRECAVRAAIPVIQGLRSKADLLRERELEWLFNRLPDLDERSTRLIEEFSKRLVNKLLHTPTLKLKEKSASGDGEVFTSVLNELFALEVR